ncbi:ROK family protein [bacterium]|nr:ROK family protein [bacterium]
MKKIRKAFLSIDLGGTITEMGLFSLNGQIIHKTSFKTPSKEFPEVFFNILNEKIGEILNKNHFQNKNIKALGMGSPGPIDTQKGIMLYSANFPKWKNVDFRSYFKNEYGFSSFFENDVNLVGLGEYELHLKDKYKSIIILTLGTGVGGVYIENGNILRGEQGYGGEFGHIQIVEDGILCGCGSKGCLEAYVSASGIKKRLEHLKKDNIQNREFIVKLEDLSPYSVYKLAKENNEYALEFFKKTGYYLGLGLKTIVNIFNPETIIIGGGMYRSLKFILPETRKYIKNNAFKIMVKGLKIEKLKLSQDSALYGGYLLAKRNI